MREMNHVIKRAFGFFALLFCCVLLFFCLWHSPWSGIAPRGSEPKDTESGIPAYSGQDYVILNDNRPAFTEQELAAEPHVTFSPLDMLGRTGVGEALLGPELLPTEPRGRIGYIQPSGWHTVRYDDLIEDRYLYNRSHVIGYLLCGDSATPENLFTGTRHLNSTTMLQFEVQVAQYIEKTGKHVAYRVTPAYHEEDLVALGVQIEALSVEDAGKGLSMNVFVYNIQPGIIIDYRTGDSRRDPDYETDHSAVVITEESENVGSNIEGDGKP